MVLGIVIPDGVGIKNYLFTAVPQFLLEDKRNSIVLFHTTMDQHLLQNIIAPFGSQMQLEPLPMYNEGVQCRIIRESIILGRLSFFSKKLNNPTILPSAAPIAHSFKSKILKRICSIYASYMSRDYDHILGWEKKYEHKLSTIDVSAQLQLLKKYKVDMLFSLHQRPLENIPMYEAARRMSIPRCSVIYSWDNVGKARLNTPSDKYLLWSQYMHDQMRLFYPEIPAEKLVITGTPQFSFYFDPAFQTSRKEFFESLNLDETKPLVLFTGSDRRSAPYDPQLLRDTAEAILAQPASVRPHLIFRRTPADFSSRYDWVLEKYPWIVKLDPAWLSIGNSWATVIPTQKDLKTVVALVQHCAMVINVGSTMALDAATHHKPCIYLSYHPAEARAEGMPLYNDVYDFDHFKVMKDIDAVVFVDHEKKLGQTIQDLLKQEHTMAPGKEKYLQIITDNLHTEAAKNVANEILNMVPQPA